MSDLSDFDLEVVSTAHEDTANGRDRSREDLVNLAGPSARYVAAAKRRSKAVAPQKAMRKPGARSERSERSERSAV